jgi:putative PIN family toxin of toxin-antitoxin system
LLLSQAVEDEYREVIFRPKFDRFVGIERRQHILDIVIVAAERVEPTEAIRECRDPKDDKYLALAAAGGADVIVSSDVRHLLSMHPWRRIPVLSLPIFWLFPDKPARPFAAFMGCV